VGQDAILPGQVGNLPHDRTWFAGPKGLLWAVVILALFLGSLGPAPAAAGEAVPPAQAGAGSASDAPEIAAVRVGIAGRYKPGLWTPVEVVLRGGKAASNVRVVLTVPDSDDVPTRIPAAKPLQLQPGVPSRVLLYARIGRSQGTLTVELLPDGGDSPRPLAHRTFEAGPASGDVEFLPAVSSRDSLIVVLGKDIGAIERATGNLRPELGERATVARLNGVDRLPTEWYGYEGIDTLILLTSRPDLYAGLKADGPRMAALEQWIRMGGTVVLCGGRRAEALVCDGPLARFLPGKFVGTPALRQTNALEMYAGSRVPIPRGRDEFRVTQLAVEQGTVEAQEGNLPLVVRKAMGFGHVVFTAFDLDESPLNQWQDLSALITKVLDLPTATVDSRDEVADVMHYGFDDLSGQLRSALDQFPGVTIVPFWIIVAALVGYLVLIGPGDYFFVGKVLRRVRLTWVTFPLVVVACCVAAYVVGERLKGDRVRVNQVDLIDIDAASGLVRGAAWANLFSPNADRYDVSFAPQFPQGDAAKSSTIVAWMGLPGSGLGGMSPIAIAPTAYKLPYDFQPLAAGLTGVPVQVSSTKSFTARWTGQMPVRVSANLGEKDGIFQGKVTNQYDFPLVNARLCFGRWAYELGTLEPGQSATIDGSTERRDLKTFLTGQKWVAEQGRDVKTPYDRGSVDLDYILRGMMFFKAAGGYRYTNLVNRYQGFVDTSDLLTKTGHAILVARPGSPERPVHGAELLRGGQSLADPDGQHTTVFRFVFPVQGTAPREH
jgi:hypothetical protein